MRVYQSIQEEPREKEMQPDGTYRVRCMNCGISVSSPLRDPVTVRAWVICPECIEKYGISGEQTR